MEMLVDTLIGMANGKKYTSYSDIPLSLRLQQLEALRLCHEAELVRQILGPLKLQRVLLVHGPPGCGKTTAALMAVKRLRNLEKKVAYFDRPEDIQMPEVDCDLEVLVVDNFLGTAGLEDYTKWRKFLKQLAQFCYGLSNKARVLLVARSDVIEQGFARLGITLRAILGKHNMITLLLPMEKVWRQYTEPGRELPLVGADNCPIGFPFLCSMLDSAQRLGMQEAYFIKDPKRALLAAFEEKLLDKTFTAAYAVLALADRPVHLDHISCTTRHRVNGNERVSSKDILGLWDDDSYEEVEDNSDQCRGCIANNDYGLLQCIGEFYSFRSDTLKTLFLEALCRHWPYDVARWCDIQDLSLRLPLFIDMERRHLDLKNNLRDRLVTEINNKSFRDAFCPVLEDLVPLQLCDLGERATEKLCSQRDNHNCPFLFWAAARPLLLAEVVARYGDNFTEEQWHEILVGCCFYGGHNRYFQGGYKLSTFLEPLGDTAARVMTKDLCDILGLGNSLVWSALPFYPEDNLLTLAAWRGHTDLLREVLPRLKERGEEVHKPGRDNQTPVMHAAARGEAEIVQMFYGCGPTNHVDAYLNTVLHYASIWEPGTFLRCMHCSKSSDSEKCIKCTTSANSKNGAKMTPELVGCERGFGCSEDLISRLTHDQGVVADGFDRTLLHFACMHPDLQKIRALSEPSVMKCAFDGESLTDFTPFGYAALGENSLNKLQFLMKQFGSKSIKQADIEFACMYSTASCVEELLRAEVAKVPTPTIFGEAVSAACKAANVEVVNLLKDHIPSFHDRQVVKCLEACASSGSLKCFEANLLNGKNIPLLKLVIPVIRTGNVRLLRVVLGKLGTTLESAGRKQILQEAVRSDSPKMLKKVLSQLGTNSLQGSKDLLLQVAIKEGKVLSLGCLLKADHHMSKELEAILAEGLEVKDPLLSKVLRMAGMEN